MKSIKESKIHEGPHSLAGVLMVVTMTTKAPWEKEEVLGAVEVSHQVEELHSAQHQVSSCLVLTGGLQSMLFSDN